MQNGGFEIIDPLASGGGDTEGFIRLDAETEKLFVGEAVAEVGFVEEEKDGLARFEGLFGDLFIAVIRVM